VQPVGSEKTLRVNVRILAATHKDLEGEVAAGRFREDLFYRLNVLELRVPPLRDRPEDIPRLAQTFLAEAARRMGRRVAGFTPQALAALVRHRFPGNVRELQNEAERAAIVVEGGSEGREAAVVGLTDLSRRIGGGGPRAPEVQRAASSLAELYAELEPKERALVEEALDRAKGNIAEAARLLGISRPMMKVRMKRFGIGEGNPD
jgi:DNA-binding NtrC family response regulator